MIPITADRTSAFCLGRTLKVPAIRSSVRPTNIIVAIMFVGRTELRIAGTFNVLPKQNADVRSAVMGIIEEIYVNEGDEVKAGDLIARLSDFDLRADLLKTEALVNQTRAKLQLLETGPTEDDIEVAKTADVGAEGKVKYSQARLHRDK